jgi:hypothetical protein
MQDVARPSILRRLAFRGGSVLLAGVLAASAAGGRAADAPARVDFVHAVVPLIRRHCGECHTGDARQGGFSMNTREAVLAGGDSGLPGVVPGDPAAGELIARITSADADLRMPADGDPLPEETVRVFRRWIAEAATWESGFAFEGTRWEPPLELRPVPLPPPHDGRTNPVDRVVDAWHAERAIARPPRCDDRTFIRRASLDLVGLLPDAERVERFVSDADPSKRARLVRELLDDAVPYAEHWLTFWNDLLRNDYSGTGFITGGRRQVTAWLHRSLVENKPFDRFVRELIAPAEDSRGFIDGIVWRGTVNASQTVPIQFAQNVGQTFLGINLKCASCHDSFVDRWTLRQTYDLAAVLAPTPLELHRCDKATGVTASPGWPFAEIGQVDPARPPRERLVQLAALLTDPRNGWLSRTLVNRLWHRLLGRGIVHPVDSLRTRPWSEDLLEVLAGDLVSHGWDLKHVLETIATSEAYGAATPAAAAAAPGDYVFAGPLPRRLTAEQFTDCVWQLTGDAPPRADAEVVRVKPDPSLPPPPPPIAKWIWTNAAAASPPGEKRSFTRGFDLADVPIHAALVVTCDNEATVFVNGRRAAGAREWSRPEGAIVTGALRKGANEILVVAANAAAGGPAALRLELVGTLADKAGFRIATDASWRWTAAVPGGNGRFAKGKEPADWEAAVEVGDQSIWASSDGPFASTLGALSASGEMPMVRAALMKATPLMAALGRPNRDQVVTSRPTDLTTLEAIQLANESALNGTFLRGGERLLLEIGPDPVAIARRIFSAALCRPPTPAEEAAAGEILGREPSKESVADCLWAVVMLPEFQLVR